MRRHILEPEEADPGILDPPADVDRLLDPPALVDVAHQFDVGADRLAHPPHALDLLGGRGVAGQGELRLHLAEALVLEPPGRGDDLVERQVAPQRAARIGRHPLARPAEQFPQRLAERLAADVPQRDVDRRQRQGEHPGRPGAARRGAQLGDDRLDAQRVFADRQRAEIVDGAFQRGGDGAPVKGHPDPFDAVIGIDPQDHDRPGGTRVFRGIGERVRLRHHQDLRADARYLHRSTSQGKFPVSREKRGFSVRMSSIISYISDAYVLFIRSVGSGIAAEFGANNQILKIISYSSN